MIDPSLSQLKASFRTIISQLSTPKKGVTVDAFKRAYRQYQSITGYLPWVDILSDKQVLLDDNVSVAAVYELTTIPSEARSDEYLIAKRDAIENFICNAFPEERQAPWVVSFYSWRDETAFRQLPEQLRRYAYANYAKRNQPPHAYTDWFIDEVFTPHIEDLAQQDGLFTDPLFGDTPWRGNLRKLYVTFYRRNVPHGQRKRGLSPEGELEQQCKRFETMTRSLGLQAQRLDSEAIRNWLFLWLNPKPKLTQGDSREWLQKNPYLGAQKEALPDYDLSADVMSRNVRSDAEQKYWYFDGQPHALVTVEKMVGVPAVGELSAERYSGDATSSSATIDSFFDKLPEGSVIIATYVVKPQSLMKRKMDQLKKRSKGDSAECRNTADEIKHAEQVLAKRSTKLYPYSLAIAIKADDEHHLAMNHLAVDAALTASHLHAVDYDDDDLMLDRYLRFLPMAYDPALEQIHLRERVIYSHHLANILPIYGRSVGTDHIGIVGFNRGGEPVMCDPFNPNDRSRNAHLFLYGPTGAGKSSLLTYLMMLLTAVHFPRWVVVEAGASFNLLTQHFKKMGVRVGDRVLRPGQAPSLAPFKAALRLVDEQGEVIDPADSKGETAFDVEQLADQLTSEQDSLVDEAVDPQEGRDILGELLIIARLMVTGGEAREEEKISRQDKALLKKAILNAAKTVTKANKADVLTEDVSRALRQLQQARPEAAARITEMADAMDLFCEDFHGELFNRPGEPLADYDFLRIEMGTLASNEEFRDKLNVGYISLVNQIVARAERTQRDGRETIFLTDEAHVLTTNKLLASYLVIISKLAGRRMGLWLWQATQHMKDYQDDAKKMLSMFEWWLILRANSDELKEAERFLEFTPDQKKMLCSTRKEEKKYTEGVIFGSKVEALFRNIPPPLCLALCMTEKHEKSARERIQRQTGCTELEAAHRIAEQIRASRRQSLEVAC